MKNKLLLSTLLLSSFVFASEEVYKGCGTDEQSARVNLANNISTKVESTSTLDKKNRSILGIDFFSKSFSRQSKQTTNLELQNVKISSEKNKVCASVTKDELYDLAIKLIEKIKTYDGLNLPQYEKDKVIAINNILVDINNALSLSDLFKQKIEEKTKELLKEKKIYFTNLRNRYNSQFLKVTIVGEFDKLNIDDKSAKSNEELFLKEGTHKINVDAKGYCPIETSVNIEKNKDLQKIINIDDYKLPYMIISSNKDNANLKIDGKTKELGVKHIFKYCDNSEIPYEISYGEQKKSGTFSLKPNNSLEDSFAFYSQKELNQFRDLAKSYEDTTRLEIKYGYMGVSLKDQYKDFEDLNTLQINLINSKKAIRYGYGLLYGQGDLSKAYELYYNLGVQLATFGTDNNALRVGPVVIVPSITAQVGVGYHKLYKEDETDSSNYKSRFNKLNEDENYDFSRDTLILRGNFGIDFIVSEYIGFNIFASKQFTMEESTTFGAGISISF